MDVGASASDLPYSGTGSTMALTQHKTRELTNTRSTNSSSSFPQRLNFAPSPSICIASVGAFHFAIQKPIRRPHRPACLLYA